MKILFTGSSGFVGKAYCKKAREEGYDIIEFDLPDHDLLNTADMMQAIIHCDMVIHCAAIANLNDSIKQEYVNFDVNVHATYRLAKICADFKKPLIFISTCCAYGNSLDAVEVEYKTNPMCNEPYAVSKVAAEYLLRGIPNLEYVILRVGTIYGIGMRKELFNYIALDSVLRNRTIYVDGDGTQTRQYVHIDDLVTGMIRATKCFREWKGDMFNLCGVEHTSVMETITAAEGIIGKKAIVQHREDRYGQTYRENISCENARIKLGWVPRWTFFEGMRDTFHNDPRFK